MLSSGPLCVDSAAICERLDKVRREHGAGLKQRGQPSDSKMGGGTGTDLGNPSCEDSTVTEVGKALVDAAIRRQAQCAMDRARVFRRSRRCRSSRSRSGRHRHHRSSSSGSSDESFFRSARLSDPTSRTIKETVATGAASLEGAENMQRFLSLRVTDAAHLQGGVPVTAAHYLSAVLLPSLRSDVPDPVRWELRTLPEALDWLPAGGLVEAAILPMRRFQAVVLDATTGWKGARHLGTIPETNVSSLNPAIRDKAVRKEQCKVRTRPGSTLGGGAVTSGHPFTDQGFAS